MTTFERSLKSITVQGLDVLFKMKGILVGIIATGLGILLGYLLSSPVTAEVTISILVILGLLLVVINNPLNGVLVWLMLTLNFVESWIRIPMGAGIPDLSFNRFGVAFVLVVMLARAAIGKLRFARLGLAEICIVGTTIGIMISAPLAAVSPSRVLQVAFTMHFSSLVAYFFTRNLVRDKKDLNKLLLAIVIFGFVASLYAIYEHTTGNVLFLSRDKSAGQLLTQYSENLRLIRGLLGRAGNFGRVLTSTIPITFYLFFENKTVTRRNLLLGMLAVQFYGIFLTYNRTSWYALLMSLSILQFFYPQFRKVYLVIVLVAAIVLWATWDQVNESAVVEERIYSKGSTLEGRQARWQAGYDMWLAKPMRGWGFGQYQKESGRFRTDGGHKNFRGVENEYLDMLVSSGLIGFLPYLFFLLTPLVNSVRLFFRARAPDWSGFIKPETITIYWAVILSFAIGSYTQIQTQLVVKMIPFAVAGAVVGSHQYLLHGSKATNGSSPNLPQTTVTAEKINWLHT